MEMNNKTKVIPAPAVTETVVEVKILLNNKQICESNVVLQLDQK
ncbi:MULTISPECIES: hypothetical protein [Bacillus]|nr:MULTISPECIES: hypothetical protein [Bacillus]EDZ50666.1 hypothetical protein BCAH1134_2424 [Bacillus cereus AH1134]MEB9947830.1 hypothetical protein [Bacillus cereus]SMD38482.1 hypothetical protein SAMN06272738_3287 [Bacillus sp. JKS001846]